MTKKTIKLNNKIYSRKPLFFKENIPVFSKPNIYTENYEKISSDHVRSMKKGLGNPSIPENLWVELEKSTIGLIKKYSSNNDRILDVGVGLGRILENFPNLQKFGMDISFEYLKEAKSKKIEVCYSLIEDMPFMKASFDLVVCTDVLEHVIDLNSALKKILGVIKKDGFLIIRVPYREDLGLYLQPDYLHKFAHLRNFDENSLQLLFEKIFDCKVIEWATTGYIHDAKKLKLKLPKLEYFITNRLRSFHSQRILKIFFEPIEINMVIRKI